MGKFIFQGVINVGIQILLIIFVGWGFARLGIVQEDKFIPQLNLFILQVALPSFNLYLLGIKLPLQTADAWHSLSAFVVWGAITQIAITIYTWKFAGGRLATAGTLNMNMLMLNYGIIGYLGLVAILGPARGSIALLTAVVFFLQLAPYTIAAFEWEKFVLAHPVHVEHMAAQQQLEQQQQEQEDPQQPQKEEQQPVAEQVQDGAGSPGPRATPYSFTSVTSMNGRTAAGDTDNSKGKTEHALAFGWPHLWLKPGRGAAPAAAETTAADGAPDPDPDRAEQGGLVGPQRLEWSSPLPWGHSHHHVMHLQHYEYAMTHLLSTAPEAKTLGKGCAVVPYEHFGAGPPPPTAAAAAAATDVGATFKSQAAPRVSFALSVKAGTVVDQPGTAVTARPSDNPHRQERTAEAAALWNYHAHPHHAVWVLNTAPDEQHRVVKEATGRVVAHYGGTLKAVWNFLLHHEELWVIVRLVLYKPVVWTVMVAIAVSASGLREFLDPASPRSVEGLWWIAGALAWLTAVTVPATLFSNGAWMYGKNIFPKRQDVPKVVMFFFLKIVVLPFLMVGCCKLVRLGDEAAAAMTLVTLSPPAAASFAIAIQYNVGVEVVTFFNIVGVIFIAPLMIGWANFLSRSGILPGFSFGAQ